MDDLSNEVDKPTNQVGIRALKQNASAVIARVTNGEELIVTDRERPVGTGLCTEAGRVDPPVLRSLDAIHVASALSLGDELEAVVTYDERMVEACAVHGIQVLAPA